MPNTEPVYWSSPVGATDDFQSPIDDEIIDARTVYGPWALMSPASFARYGGTNGRLGLGLGQRFKKQPDGRFLKVEG